MVLGTIISIIGLLSIIWVIYDVVTYQKKMNTTNKIIWIITGILFNIITAIIYYFIVKKK